LQRPEQLRVSPIALQLERLGHCGANTLEDLFGTLDLTDSTPKFNQGWAARVAFRFRQIQGQCTVIFGDSGSAPDRS
jgi:hypothetical protein